MLELYRQVNIDLGISSRYLSDSITKTMMSKLLTSVNWLKCSPKSKILVSHVLIRKMGSDHPSTFVITPSRWQWHMFKNLLHGYLMLGFIICGTVVFYANVFIGPAQLTAVPKDYSPRPYEYYQHPITRFLATYLTPSYQQDYEKYMHVIYEEAEKAAIRSVERKVFEKMGERLDYKAWYYRPAYGKYARLEREKSQQLNELWGD